MKRRTILKQALFGLAPAAILFSQSAQAFELEELSLGYLSNWKGDTPEIINAGVGGNNTIDILARLDSDCLDRRPKLTILMVGTNDMNSVKYVPLEQFRRNLELIVDKIRRTGSKILIMSILPGYEPYLLTRHPPEFYLPEGVKGRREQVNDLIAQLAAKRKLHFLDLCHSFEAIGKVGLDRESLIQNEKNAGKTDGIHPTGNGYRFIALTVYDYIKNYKLPLTRIVCLGDSITKGDGSLEGESYPAYLKKLLS